MQINSYGRNPDIHRSDPQYFRGVYRTMHGIRLDYSDACGNGRGDGTSMGYGYIVYESFCMSSGYGNGNGFGDGTGK